MSVSIRQLALRLVLADGERLEAAAGMLGRLPAAELERLLTLVREQRLAPLVLHRLQVADLIGASGADLGEALAADVQGWKESARRSRLAHLQVSRLLGQAGIEVLALKGADLAWNLYPQPWLRPQRDLDLLLPEERLAEALRLLEEIGCRLEEGSRRPSQPGFWWHHHCSVVHPLGVKLELHRGLWRMPVDRWPEDFSLRRDFSSPTAGQHYRRREGELLFLAPLYLHLHCLVHHLHSHLSNVGPLGLHDLKLLAGWSASRPEALAVEAARIGAPGLPSLADALVAWGSGERTAPPYPGAEELLFMDRFRLFSLQMTRRPLRRLLAGWWSVHRRGNRWSEAAVAAPLPQALARALLLLPALALQPGLRRLLGRRLLGRNGFAVSPASVTATAVAAPAAGASAAAPAGALDHPAAHRAALPGADALRAERESEARCRIAASQLERWIRTPG